MQENANRNILSCIKIKNVEYPIKMLSSNSDNTITIKDLYKKTNIDEHSFVMDRVFATNESPEDTFRYIYKNSISKAFDGINCALFTLGVDGGGKNYTLMGDPIKS